MDSQKNNIKKFGTFAGVFTPTLLTILGVIMYLRLGWVVGNAGLLGAWLIIIISFLITLCTALSMSAITTNIRIGAGGAYAIISQALGLEVGEYPDIFPKDWRLPCIFSDLGRDG